MTNDPNQRPFIQELTFKVDELKHWLPCCPNCVNWNPKTELCGYDATAPNRIAATPQRPPAPVIAFGCWAFDHDVPF